jgi:mevalonate kinase
MIESTTPTYSPTAYSRAPGKVILSGEHFVVLGAPAIAMAIDLYSRAEVRPNLGTILEVEADLPLKFSARSDSSMSIRRSVQLLQPLRIAAEAALDHIGKRRGLTVNVDCQIPIGAGLGSSASTTVAITSAISRSMGVSLSRQRIFNLAFEPERFLHGSPSGVDQATCIYGGTIEFTRPGTVKKLAHKWSPVMLLCDTGIHHTTKTLVNSVVKRSKKNKERFQSHLVEVSDISNGVARALRRGDGEELGSLMLLNHRLLQRIGVSHPKLDLLVDVATNAGAFGAKLTGAGGGGCIIAVCPTTKARESIAKKLRRVGGIPFKISQDTEGVVSSLGRALK